MLVGNNQIALCCISASGELLCMWLGMTTYICLYNGKLEGIVRCHAQHRTKWRMSSSLDIATGRADSMRETNSKADIVFGRRRVKWLQLNASPDGHG